MIISPLVGSSSPERQLSSVVLPQPLGPIIATISPRCTEKSTPRSAATFPAPASYSLRTPVASIISTLASSFLVTQRISRGHTPCLPRGQKGSQQLADGTASGAFDLD